MLVYAKDVTDVWHSETASYKRKDKSSLLQEYEAKIFIK